MSQKARPLLPPMSPTAPASHAQYLGWGLRAQGSPSVCPPPPAFWAHSAQHGGRCMQKSRSHRGMGRQEPRASSEKGQRHEISEGYRGRFPLGRGDIIYTLKWGIKGQSINYREGSCSSYKPAVSKYVLDIENQKSQEKTILKVGTQPHGWDGKRPGGVPMASIWALTQP